MIILPLGYTGIKFKKNNRIAVIMIFYYIC